MKKIRNQMDRMCGVFAVKAMEARRKMAERSGEGYVDTAVKILIAVVLGALLLAGLYACAFFFAGQQFFEWRYTE